jgi:hypothetical protein
MRLLHAPRYSPQQGSSPDYDSHSRSREWFANCRPEEMASRHDSQMLVVRRVPADPYDVWLHKREADRRASMVASPTMQAGRFSRIHSTKAPWEAIRVRLTPDRPTTGRPC